MVIEIDSVHPKWNNQTDISINQKKISRIINNSLLETKQEKDIEK